MNNEATTSVRPADGCMAYTDSAVKSPIHSFPPREDDLDEKFVRYDSSPESVVSYTDGATFSSIDDDGHGNPVPLLDMVRACLSSCRVSLNSSITFPIALDQRSERLLSTYLTKYAGCVYGMNSPLRPNPTAAALSMAMNSPACFHLVLARSAQFQLSWSTFHTPEEQRDLEMAVMEHKGEAMQIIRHLSVHAVEQSQVEDLLIGVISLGLLELNLGDNDSATLHFAYFRKVLKSIGGPLSIQTPWFSDTMLHWECGYASPARSCVWDQTDFSRLLTELNQFFSSIWSLRRPSPTQKQPTKSRTPSLSRHCSAEKSTSRSRSPVETHIPTHFGLGLIPDSLLHEILSQKSPDPRNHTSQDSTTLILQLNCLLLLAYILHEHSQEPTSSDSSTVPPIIETIHTDIASTFTSLRPPVNEILWSLQIHELDDPAHTHRAWTVAGWVWVLRHVSFNVQDMVRDWLVAVLAGKEVTKVLKLDSFAFSYTC